MAHVRRAEIQMLPTDAGGLSAPLPTPTRHLLLVFAATTHDELQIGAEIATDGDASLEPGGIYTVQLTFWAPEAGDALARRDQFVLWAGRMLGAGRLLPDQA